MGNVVGDGPWDALVSALQCVAPDPATRVGRCLGEVWDGGAVGPGDGRVTSRFPSTDGSPARVLVRLGSRRSVVAVPAPNAAGRGMADIGRFRWEGSSPEAVVVGGAVPQRCIPQRVIPSRPRHVPADERGTIDALEHIDPAFEDAASGATVTVALLSGYDGRRGITRAG